MTATLKSKQTLIATVRNHLRTLASFPTLLIFHWSLPLMNMNGLKKPLWSFLGNLVCFRWFRFHLEILRQGLCTFLNQRYNCAPLMHFADNIERKEISTLIRGGGTFLQGTESSQVETIQQIKKAFFINQFQNFNGNPKSLEAKQ
jgi:hypothetical protein